MAWSSPGTLLGPAIAVYLKCNGNVPFDPSGQYTWEDIAAYLARRTDLNTGLFHALQYAEQESNDAVNGRQYVCECLQYMGANVQASSAVEQLLRSYSGDIAAYATKARLLELFCKFELSCSI